MPFYFFVWNDEIIDHLTQNDVTPEEFEQVVSAPGRVEMSHSSGQPIAFGYADDGRYLACVYKKLDADHVLPITAYEVSEE